MHVQQQVSDWLHVPGGCCCCCCLQLVCAGHKVLPDGVQLRISGGRLDLPQLTLKREWFSMLSSTCKLQLLDVEQQQQEDGQQQQQQRRRASDEFFVRLAPYAEELELLPAGRLFEGALVTANFHADLGPVETRRLLVRRRTHSTAANIAIASAASCCRHTHMGYIEILSCFLLRPLTGGRQRCGACW